VFFYRRVGGTWTEVDRVTLPTASLTNGATAVDLGDDVALAGVTAPPNSGRVFLLRREAGDWTLEKELLQSAPGPTVTDFGAAVSVDGDALVGNPQFQDGAAPYAGKALFYPTTRVTLSVDSKAPVVGDTLRFVTCGGAPGDLATLVQTHINDIPAPATTAALGIIGPDGSWTITPKAPGSLIGSSATFEATVMTAAGPRTSNPQRIKVSGSSLPVCNAVAFGPGTAGQPVFFSGASSFATNGGQIVRWQWTFDDGATASGASVGHVFLTAGVHLVELTVTDSKRGKSTCSTQVFLVAPPACLIQGGTTAPFGTSVAFDGSQSTVPGLTATGYAWDFGDGTLGSGAQTTHTFSAPGTFLVELTVSYSDGSTRSCTRNVTATTPAGSCLIAPLAVANVGVPTSFDGTASMIAGQTVVSYGWTFGDGAQGSGATPMHTYAAPGSYLVKLTVTYASGISALCSKVQLVNTPPSCVLVSIFPSVSVGQFAAFTGASSTDPDGTIAGYSWDFGDGTGAVGMNASHKYTAPGTFTVTLTVTDNQGATSSCTDSVLVVP
jgi:PKD repeat protein